jgi:hypothetical protein
MRLLYIFSGAHMCASIAALPTITSRISDRILEFWTGSSAVNCLDIQGGRTADEEEKLGGSWVTQGRDQQTKHLEGSRK